MKPYTWRSAILKSDLMSTTRHVLLTLSCYLNDAGQSAYPSTKLLAADTGLSERAVITHLKLAAEAGWLKIRKAGFGGQAWAHNEYYPSTPSGDFDTEGAEASSVASEEKALNDVPKALNVIPEGTEPDSKGTEPNDIKALNDVQSNSPLELSIELSKNNKRGQAAQKFDVKSELMKFGVEERIADAWIKHRKDKRASTSLIVVEDRIEQAALARITLQAALKMEVSRGWQGFQAEWAMKNQAAKPQQSARYDRNDRSAAAAAIYGSDEPEKEFIDVN